VTSSSQIEAIMGRWRHRQIRDAAQLKWSNAAAHHARAPSAVAGKSDAEIAEGKLCRRFSTRGPASLSASGAAFLIAIGLVAARNK